MSEAILTVECQVTTSQCDGRDELLFEKTFANLSVMELKRPRAWVRRMFNRALREAGRDQIITGSYSGQLERAPYTFYSASLSGVNGQTMRERGDFDV